MPLNESETHGLVKLILEKLERIEQREGKINMLITDLASAITTIDTTVNAIAAAVSALPAGTVPQPAVDALTKLATDLATLQALVTPPPTPTPAPAP